MPNLDAEVERLGNAVLLLEERINLLENHDPDLQADTSCEECGSSVDHFDTCPHYTTA